MNAVILAIGDELTSGQTVDSNSAWLSRELHRRGIPVIEHLTVSDNRPLIADAFTRAAEKAQLVLSTGGLGPTADDLTRQALADALGCELVLHEQSLQEIAEYFRRRGREMRQANRVQAMVPADAEPIDNEVGTAPGVAARLHGAQVYVMPGVPREMRWMFEQRVVPHLPPGAGAIVHRILHTYGRGESDIGAEIADLMKRDGPLKVGTTASAGQVSVRITSQAGDADQAMLQADGVAAEIRRRLGELVFGEEEETMASVVGRLLAERSRTLATAESCTGGMIGEMLTSVSGASAWYVGGAVCYSNDLKQRLLGVGERLLVEHGAVSEPVARAMAAGARDRLGADWAIAVTGIAGPTGGTEGKPVGTVWIGRAGPDGVEAFRHIFPGDRETIRRRASLAALHHLRQCLTPLPNPRTPQKRS